MNRKPVHAAILHSGPWKNLFGDFPSYLSRVTGLPLVETPEGLDMAYVMGWPEHSPLPCESFIPLEAVYLAHDKRKQAAFFSTNGITTPETHLIFSEADALAFHRNRPDREWLLKWPTGCGGTGHQVLDDNTRITPFWKPPFLVQELIRMEVPRVYRLFAAGGETFNWCVREGTAKTGSSPFISYGTGASLGLRKMSPRPRGSRPNALFAQQGYGTVSGLLTLFDPTGESGMSSS